MRPCRKGRSGPSTWRFRGRIYDRRLVVEYAARGLPGPDLAAQPVSVAALVLPRVLVLPRRRQNGIHRWKDRSGSAGQGSVPSPSPLRLRRRTVFANLLLLVLLLSCCCSCSSCASPSHHHSHTAGSSSDIRSKSWPKTFAAGRTAAGALGRAMFPFHTCSCWPCRANAVPGLSRRGSGSCVEVSGVCGRDRYS